jgi:hypothetical protein
MELQGNLIIQGISSSAPLPLGWRRRTSGVASINLEERMNSKSRRAHLDRGRSEGRSSIKSNGFLMELALRE